MYCSILIQVLSRKRTEIYDKLSKRIKVGLKLEIGNVRMYMVMMIQGYEEMRGTYPTLSISIKILP
jgi:hypothetical protein